MLKNIWKGLTNDHVSREKVIVLYDPEHAFNETRANVYGRSMPQVSNQPIQKGVEHLFSHETLERARKYKFAFIDVVKSWEIKRGERLPASETWTVNENEKRCLCDWLCQNGTADDFQHFRPVLEMLSNIIEETPKEPVE